MQQGIYAIYLSLSSSPLPLHLSVVIHYCTMPKTGFIADIKDMADAIGNRWVERGRALCDCVSGSYVVERVPAWDLDPSQEVCLFW